MDINYTLDQNNCIIEWHSVPFTRKKPFISIKDPYKIRLGFSQIIKGQLILNESAYIDNQDKHRQVMALSTQMHQIEDKLAATDYKVLKFCEGLITEAEYLPIKEERQNYRNEINRFKAEIEAIIGS